MKNRGKFTFALTSNCTAIRGELMLKVLARNKIQRCKEQETYCEDSSDFCQLHVHMTYLTANANLVAISCRQEHYICCD
jgi:hypothetical protein